MQTFKFLAAALVVVGVSAGAQANVITQTGTIAQQTTDFSNKVFNVSNGYNSTNFADFNASLGTLTGVALTMTLTGVETGTLTNQSVETQTFDFSSDSNMFLNQATCVSGPSNPSCTSAGSGPAVLGSTDLFSTGLFLTEATEKYTLGPNASTSILPTPNAFGTGIVDETDTYTGADANEFIGTGGFQINASTQSGSTFLGGGGNLSSLLATQDGATISLVYTYTPFATVPEPASFALLGAGLIGMTFMARRRRSV